MEAYSINLPTIEGYNPPQQVRSKLKEKKLKAALIELLIKGKRDEETHEIIRGFQNITNQDIANKAKVHIQSFYQWFEKGKETLVSVMAEEYYRVLLTSAKSFFDEPIRLNQDVESFVKDFNHRMLEFYKTYQESVLILFNFDIPESLRRRTARINREVMMIGTEFLKNRGLGQRRYLIATTIYKVLFFMRESSIKPAYTEDGFHIVIDNDVEEELYRLLVGYLKPYFEFPELSR